MKLNFDVTAQEYEIIHSILEDYLQKADVYVFGSRAKQTSRFNSDLDLAIDANELVSKETLIDLKEDFNDSNLRYSVDIVDINAIDENFRKLVDAEKVMFASFDKKTIPSLRFPEFTGEWEEKRLNEITDYVDYRGKSPTKTEKGTFLVTAKNIKKGYIDYTNSKEYISTDDYDQVMKRGLPSLDDVLLTTEAPLGNVALVDNENIALAQRVIKFRGKENKLFNRFLLHVFMSDCFQRLLITKAIGTTVLGIQGKVLHNLNLFIPNIDEQEKIAAFLSGVDERVEQLSRKVSLLERYKKGVMQKIFSQEIRFKADDGSDFPNWQEKKLGDVGEIIGGGTPDTSELSYWGGDIKWFSPTEIKNKYIKNSNKMITETGLKNSSAKILPKGALLLTTRATIGDVSIALDDCTTNQGFQSIVVNRQHSNEFIYYLVLTITNKIIKYANGSTFLEISKNELSSIKILIPGLLEQQKITNFLSDIDNNIEETKKQLELNEQFKKALLQRMFV
ncbi:MAG: hypothetical protein C0603_10515 [Denitrovibrio sp.]|nr:MAG: hypothetical protein C0603_10515 [Denitrovibrio sp.]